MISYALFRFQGDGGIPGITTPRRMAACLIIATPLIIIFIIFRKKLMGSLTIGGIKG
jgi:ABC-type maltose transport system permease subunit